MRNLAKTSSDRLKSNVILHITPGLRRGGAEMMLTRLVTALDGKQGYKHVILSLEPGNAFASEHEEAGIKVLFLGITSLTSLPWNYLRLRKLVEDINPALIHGWMYHGNMATYHAGAKCPMVFSIHNALDAWKQEKWTTRQFIRYGARISRFAHAVVYCSNISKAQHEAIGYNKTNAITIATDVGDTAHIIQDTGMIVRKEDFVTDMVKAMIEMAGMPAGERRETGKKARLSIMKRFEIRNTMDAYETLYVSLIQQFDEH